MSECVLAKKERIEMDNYDRTAMEVKIKQLEKENKYLKSLLDKAGISYFQLSESTLKTDECISS